MKFSFMRYVDDHIGMPIGYLFGRIAQAKHFLLRPHRDLPPDKVKTIFCQKYFGMGSILCAIPLIRALRQHYPNAKIIFLTLELNRETVEVCRIADEVLTINLDFLGKFIIDVMGKIFYLMRKNVDISIDLEFFSKFSMILSFISGAKLRIGLHQKGIRPEGVMTNTIYYNYYKHISEIYFAYASALGIESKPEYFSSGLSSMKKAWGEGIALKLNLKAGIPIVIVNVNASDLFKFRCWPADYFVKLIQLLIQNYPDYYYVLIGGPSDIENVNEICQKVGKYEHLINASGRTNIRELFALIEMSYLMITNDSGPMHIASLYDRNIAAFFGPETPVVYGPLNKNTLIFYSEDIYCSPCLNVYDSKQSLYRETCVKNNCLLEFKPEEVYALTEKQFFSSNKEFTPVSSHKFVSAGYLQQISGL